MTRRWDGPWMFGSLGIARVVVVRRECGRQRFRVFFLDGSQWFVSWAGVRSLVWSAWRAQ